MVSNLIYTDALPYIDVTPPYFALRNLSLLPTTSSTDYPAVSGTFSREQVPPPQNANPFCGSELGRHTAILGTVAAAYSNPVKAKHYYLALHAIADFVYFPVSQELRAEARIVSATWEKRRVNCEIKSFTLEGKFAGKMKVVYTMVTEPQLLKIVQPVDPTRVLGTAWQPGEPSPMAGHFSVIAAAPIAILSSNGIVLCRRLLESREGSRWLDQKTQVKYKRLAVVGEMLELRAKKLDGEEYSHQVEFWDEGGKMIGIIDYLFVVVDIEKEKPRL